MRIAAAGIMNQKPSQLRLDCSRSQPVASRNTLPFCVDAVAVMEKNENVAADLSGILEGKIDDMPDFLARKHGYLNYVKGWLEYLDNYERLLFGTDWPLANLSNYIKFVEHIIPDKHHEKVFFDNANRLYGLGLS